MTQWNRYVRAIVACVCLCVYVVCALCLNKPHRSNNCLNYFIFPFGKIVAPNKIVQFKTHGSSTSIDVHIYLLEIHFILLSSFPSFCFCCHNTITYIQISICVNYYYCLFFCTVTHASFHQIWLFIYLFWMRQCQHVLNYIALVFHERIWCSYLVWLIVVHAR